VGHDTGLLDGLEGVLAAGQEKDVGPGLDDKTRIIVWDLELGITFAKRTAVAWKKRR
jgi:hypothetical protein